MNYAGKVVLMTGGVSGLGQAIIKTFLDKGTKVCMTDTNISRGNELLKNYQKNYGEDRVMFTKVDVTKNEDFEKAFDEAEKNLGGAVDILVNSAMYIVTDFDRSTAINYGGIVRGTEMALKKIGKHNGGKGGHVINIGSISGLSLAFFMPYYAASKAAVIHFTRCVGHEFHYKYTGVSVQAICQDLIDTEVVEQIRNTSWSAPSTEYLHKILVDYHKMNPERVAKAAFKLIEDNQPGAALVVEPKSDPYYVSPHLTKFEI